MLYERIELFAVMILACAPTWGCAGAGNPEIQDESARQSDESATAQQAVVDSACYSACTSGCDCDTEYKPAACLRACRAECKLECECTPTCSNRACGASDGCGGICSSGACPAGQTCGGGGVPNQCGCTPQCTGKSCGASDGCGGICSNGSCPAGMACGGAGTPGQCACLPDLWAHVDGVFQLVGFNSKRGHFTFTINNGGCAAANNVKLLIQSNLSAGLLNLTTTNGFSCYLPDGYYPRLGLECVGGNIPAYSSATLVVDVAIPTSGFNVLSVFVDPDDTIAELPNFGNSANAGVQVP